MINVDTVGFFVVMEKNILEAIISLYIYIFMNFTYSNTFSGSFGFEYHFLTE